MNEHSAIFEKAKSYYNEGLWGKKHLEALIKVGKLTQEEYDEIVRGIR